MKLLLSTLLMTLPWVGSANRYNNIEFGRVVEVQPIYQSVSVPEERQVCDRRYSDGRSRNKHRTGNTILGGIIGGAIGNKFGRGSGRDASTALGVLVGASIGANRPVRERYGQSCHIQTYYHHEERMMGYDVTYEFNGELYQTQMQEYPGDRVRLRVNVDVIE